MSKVLVDRELLCQALGGGVKGERARSELRGMLSRAQPAEAEGVQPWRERIIAAHPKSEPGYWPDELLVAYMQPEIEELRAALSAVTAERDRLESMLIRTATRHFALQIKDRADDKKLDECLSEGIAMLEAERDRLRAVLEGAQYPNIDRLKALTIEQCRQVGETVMRLTIDAQSERDQLRAELEMLRDNNRKAAISDAAMAAKETEPEHVCSGCGAKGWTGNCLACIPY